MASKVKASSSPRHRESHYHTHSTHKRSEAKHSAKRMTASGSVGEFGRPVWAPDEKEGFVLGHVVDIATEKITCERVDGKGQIVAAYDSVFPAEEVGKGKAVEDACAMMYLNEGTLLDNCKLRYAKKNIYTYVANILISINPYEDIPGLYSKEMIGAYRGKSLGQMQPHVFAIADKAYREMRRTKESQSIIVSGESGAGKTESQKAILRYLCENWGAKATTIQKRLLETNPILEAFGNAKTLRNNNSSRFGKFVEIHIGADGLVAGGYVSHYLLEKSRLCRQTAGERNYHIFYQLIAGAPEELYAKLRLAPPDRFAYLRHGCTQFFAHPSNTHPKVAADRLSEATRKSGFIRDPIVDDARDFERLVQALQASGFSNEQLKFIWSTVAGILHLGNIAFDEAVNDTRGGCKVDAASEASARQAAKLLAIDPQALNLCLVTRIMQTTKGGVKGTLIRVPLKTSEAAAARDALAKAIYSRLFDWIVAGVNKSIPFDNSAHYIGVLDIAGFEFFTVNSFEQFCINYCNEKLQYFFNERILKQEQELYEKEGLNVPKIRYADNQDCIELFESRPHGLLNLLDEEAKLPRPTAQHYTTSVQEHNKDHFRLDTPRKSRLRAHREMRDEEGFLVRHYAGTVCYQTAAFLEKNNDQLHNSLEMLIEESDCALLRSLFEMTANGEAKKPTTTGGKLQLMSVAAKFKAQLSVLLDKLKATGTHFVRCVKPNGDMAPLRFDGASILSQLQCSGMHSVLRLMQKGYPSRTSFADLYATYARVLPADLARLDARLFCKCLFHALGLNTKDYAFGMTKVFFRPGKFAEFDQLLRQDPKTMAALIEKARSWLIRARWKKAAYGALSVIKLKNKIKYRAQHITRLQAAVRGFLVRKKYHRKLDVYHKSCSLLNRAKEMLEIVDKMIPASRAKWHPAVESTSHDLEKLIASVKSADLENEIAATISRYEKCVRKVDRMILDLKKQADGDAMREIERKRREEEAREQKRLADEQRQEEEKLARKRLEEEREAQQRLFEAEMIEAERRQQNERSTQDKMRELAEKVRLDEAINGRIAGSDRGALVDSAIAGSFTMSSSSASSASSVSKKYDLSSKTFSWLRDTINSSTDVELLMACRDEFHRRLRVYNEWKEKNKSASREVQAPQRAPSSVLANAANSSMNARPTQQNPAHLNAQRYFKVPFTTKSENVKNPSSLTYNPGEASGLWLAHFDGLYIARQIEIVPDRKPLLLVAGKDDLSMCELPLEMTGLTRQKGAEITEREFEQLWQHYGGRPIASWKP